MAWMDSRALLLLQALTDEGLSGKQVAERASEELQRTVTRNMVIGLWNRGTVKKGEAQQARCFRNPNYVSKAKPRQRRPQSEKVIRLYRPAPEPVPDINDLLIPAAQRKTLLQLTPRCCRWPVGHPNEPDFFFCGATAIEGSSYCAAHKQRGVRIVSVSTPKALEKAVRYWDQPLRTVRGTKYILEAAE